METNETTDLEAKILGGFKSVGDLLTHWYSDPAETTTEIFQPANDKLSNSIKTFLNNIGLGILSTLPWWVWVLAVGIIYLMFIRRR
jgi:hypothetical protein